ncbi:MAG: hypothetical protein QXS81_01110 [Candidatus Micrarchaeaceae archaeon]
MQITKKERMKGLAGELKVGQYAGFSPPERIKDRETWYGEKNTHEYNDSYIEGEVIKINPKNIKIKQIMIPEAWDYNRVYIIPKDAVVEFRISMNKARRLFAEKHKKEIEEKEKLHA